MGITHVVEPLGIRVDSDSRLWKMACDKACTYWGEDVVSKDPDSYARIVIQRGLSDILVGLLEDYLVQTVEATGLDIDLGEWLPYSVGNQVIPAVYYRCSNCGSGGYVKKRSHCLECGKRMKED